MYFKSLIGLALTITLPAAGLIGLFLHGALLWGEREGCALSLPIINICLKKHHRLPQLSDIVVLWDFFHCGR